MARLSGASVAPIAKRYDQTMTDTSVGTVIRAVGTPGLGNTTYLVASGRVGIVVDPQRDIDRFVDTLDDLGAQPRWILETHIHNDYVSGGLQLAKSTGAELLIPSSAAPAFRHTPAFHHEDHTAGEARLRPIHTPGHTPEHTSYLLIVDDQPIALFSGGSLLVGSAGRSDLLGADRADTLARLQFQSLRRLATLPDDVELLPTHGAGSFCTVSATGAPTSTIGAEKATNPALRHNTEQEFVQDQLSDLSPYPNYYRFMGPKNLAGGEPMPAISLQELDGDDVADRKDDVTFIDVRGRDAFARGHIPGSLGIELRRDFATWVGWITDIDQPVVLVAEPGQDISDAVIQLARIGYDNIEGVILGLGPWKRSGRDLASYRTASVPDFVKAMREGRPILDVRAPSEYRSEHLEGSSHRYLPDLVDGLGGLSPAEVWVACGSGYRATIAAGLLERHGAEPVVLATGGVSQLIGAP